MPNTETETVAAAELQVGASAYLDTHVQLHDAEGHPVGRTEWVGLARITGFELEGDTVRLWAVPDDSTATVLVRLDADHEVVVRSW